MGCMILSMPTYPLTPNPDDIIKVMECDHFNDFFGDMHVRGEYPGYMKRYFRENDIQIKSGFLSSMENDCYMYRVIDVQLQISFLQRIFGLGTVICVTSDATNKTIVLKNIRHAREIKDFIYQASEEAKIRRRTVNMQNIGVFEDLDGDGIPD